MTRLAQSPLPRLRAGPLRCCDFRLAAAAARRRDSKPCRRAGPGTGGPRGGASGRRLRASARPGRRQKAVKNRLKAGDSDHPSQTHIIRVRLGNGYRREPATGVRTMLASSVAQRRLGFESKGDGATAALSDSDGIATVRGFQRAGCGPIRTCGGAVTRLQADADMRTEVWGLVGSCFQREIDRHSN